MLNFKVKKNKFMNFNLYLFSKKLLKFTDL